MTHRPCRTIIFKETVERNGKVYRAKERRHLDPDVAEQFLDDGVAFDPFQEPWPMPERVTLKVNNLENGNV